MKVLLIFLSTLFLLPQAYAMDMTPLEIQRSFDAVTKWAVEENIKPTMIEIVDEHFYDGDLSSIDFDVHYSIVKKKKVLNCVQAVGVGYPYIPRDKTYEDVEPAVVAGVLDAKCL